MIPIEVGKIASNIDNLASFQVGGNSSVPVEQQAGNRRMNKKNERKYE